jgi:hypothetical protein
MVVHRCETSQNVVDALLNEMFVASHPTVAGGALAHRCTAPCGNTLPPMPAKMDRFLPCIVTVQQRASPVSCLGGRTILHLIIGTYREWGAAAIRGGRVMVPLVLRVWITS